MIPMKLFLTCPKGLELLLEEELHQLGVEDTKQTVAGVQCHGDLEDAYRICLWSRLANRVLMPVYQGDAETTEDLYDAVQQVDWLDHMRSEGTLLIDFTGQTRAINNTHFGALKVKDAIVDQIRDLTGARPSVDKVAPDLRINVRMHRGKVTVAIDLSGDSLHRRAYRLQAGQAPMKENLAAAVLLRSGWPARIADFDLLLDPMCGSGTLLIEAAMMAADIAPGLQRKRYGFSRWTGHQKGIWDELVAEANGRKAKGLSQLEISLVGRDEDKSVLRSARQNAERAGVAEFIDFAACRVEDLEREQLPQGVGLLVTNPPYGERLGETQQLMFLYRHLGDKLKEQFAGWTAAIFTSNPDLCKVMGMRADKQYKLFNGALESRLFVYPISEHRPEQRVREEEEVVPLSDGAQMFANRLLKNRKQLAKWVKKEQIECYRLYDADMPEYSVAIDIYGDEVHVQEYAAPKKIDPVKTFSRLQEVMAAIPVTLDIPANKVILKQRKKQQGSNQYEKQSETHRFKEVNEYGCRLLVNLHDYLDTGLFLDHRPIRYRIQQESAGKDVLNLFCYTGTASVHAAKGGAKTTTSIDMSATYLNWAKRNLDLNGFDQDANQQVQGDCLKWLRMQRQPAYDLIFMDPPTFSNSKRMEGVLDVQREDHVDMVDAAMRLLRKEGVLYFSNNYRRFKIDHEALSDYVVEDITYSTLDPDFKRNQRIHSCFRITHKL